MIYLIVIILLVAGLAGWYIYRDIYKTSDIQHPTINENDRQNKDKLSEQQIKERVPDLDRDFSIREDLSADYKERLAQEIKDIRFKLKEDYDDLQNWLQLGLLYKAGEDFKAAGEAWEFAIVIRPNDAVAYHNLGELYWLYLPDFPRAEEYFKKSIEINPHPLTYQKLHELYRYSYKEKADLADDVLMEAIEKNPQEPYFTYLLGQYYEDAGNISQAVEYYEKTLVLDRSNEKLKQSVENLKKKL